MTVTIHETETQKLFDAMLAHLRAQGKPAVARLEMIDKCLYRTDDGLKCALGALIPDELYQPGFELADTSEVLDQLAIKDQDHRNFLTAAQSRLHDNPAGFARDEGEYAFLRHVESNAWSLARKFSLTYTPPVEAEA